MPGKPGGDWQTFSDSQKPGSISTAKFGCCCWASWRTICWVVCRHREKGEQTMKWMGWPRRCRPTSLACKMPRGLSGGSSHWALGSAPLVRHWASTLSSRSPCRTTQRRREELTEEEDDIGSNFDQILWLKLWLKKCCIDEKCLERRLLYPLCPIPNETIGQLCKLSGSSQQAHVGNIVD